MKARNYAREAQRLGDFLERRGWLIWEDSGVSIYCPICGESDYGEDDVFCSRCGGKLTRTKECSDTLKEIVAALKHAAK